MAATCRNTACPEHGVPKWDAPVAADRVIDCGGCGQPCDRDDAPAPPPPGLG